jgi:hypothetical protein
MTVAAKPEPVLRLMRGAADEIHEMEIDLELSAKYFAKSAEIGPRVLSPEQLNNYAQIMTRARLLFTAIRAER